MFKNNRILFFVDHKFRDFKSLSLIAFYLNQKKINAKLTALWDFNYIEEFDPKIVVFNKPHLFNQEKIKCNLENRFTACITTEGQAVKRIARVPYPCDINFFWNNSQKNLYTDINNKLKTTLGCPRTDFIDIDFKKKKNLYKFKKSKNITIALPDLSSKFKGDNLNKFVKYVDQTHYQSISFGNYLNIHRKLNDEFKKNIILTAKKFKNINFLLKPHPNEDHIYWKLFIKNNKLKNLHLVYGLNIDEFLSISNLHISIEGCNTTYEAIQRNVPTAEIFIKDKTKYKEYHKAHLELCSNKIKNLKDFDKFIINYIIKNKKIKIDKKNLKNYIKLHYHIVDNQRCKAYATYLYNYLIKCNNKNYISRWIFIIKNIIKNNKSRIYLFFLLKLCIKKIIGYRSSFKKQKKNLKKYDERGRFSSRVSRNEEKTLFKKFIDKGFKI